jgi:hypothetical protein
VKDQIQDHQDQSQDYSSKKLAVLFMGCLALFIMSFQISSLSKAFLPSLLVGRHIVEINYSRLSCLCFSVVRVV